MLTKPGAVKVFSFFRDFLFPLLYNLGMELELVCQGRAVSGQELAWLRRK